MASIGHESFAKLLSENLVHEQADVRLRCILGLRQIGDPRQVSAIIPLVTDPDIAVRREAVVTLGQFGRQDAVLVALRSRLSPEVENEGSVRDAAWQSFLKVWSLQNPEMQQTWVDKLQDQPERQVVLLKDLAERTGGSELPPEQVVPIMRRLAETYDSLQRYAEAAKYWESVAIEDPDDRDAAEGLLRALLRSGQFEEALTRAQHYLVQDEAYFKPRIREHIYALLLSAQAAGQKERIALLLDLLDELLPGLMDSEFRGRLSDFRDSGEPVGSEPLAPPPASTPSGADEKLNAEVRSG